MTWKIECRNNQTEEPNITFTTTVYLDFKEQGKFSLRKTFSFSIIIQDILHFKEK